ncbi:MAG: response regulator [Planctomycetota bacterium]|nr:response regulator [Planctomycetota bacterium]
MSVAEPNSILLIPCHPQWSYVLAGIKKILRINPSGASPTDSDVLFQPSTKYFDCDNSASAIELLRQNDFDGVFLSSGESASPDSIVNLFRNQQVLNGMPDGVVLIDRETRVHWANQCLTNWCRLESPVGAKFNELFDQVEIIGPDFCPFKSVGASGCPSRTFIKTGASNFYQIHAAPIQQSETNSEFLIVTVRDVTEERIQAQKLEAIHKAGLELADLKPEEVFDMGVEERIELLKSNIIHYTSDLLNFNVVEIRLKDSETGRLETLLSEGINSEASKQELYARANGNGVTGFVAATGKSYLCEDTDKDPLYIEGLEGARSSLTVPLILHEEVIGSFNVESDEPNTFTEGDLQFLEIFSRDIAVALNTLDLLAAENAHVAIQNTQAITSAVGAPIDEILNQTVNVMDNFIGHDTEIKEKLRDVLNNALKIKQLIKNVGEEMAPIEVAAARRVEQPSLLRGRHVLVIDDDESVRQDAHRLLEKQGCIVETAYRGTQALLILQNCNEKYDAIISDIRLPDLKGYDLLLKLKDVMESPPLILMTGFGYDPGHQVVKTRQAGMPPEAFLYKPFRVDQLISTVEYMVRANSPS